MNAWIACYWFSEISADTEAFWQAVLNDATPPPASVLQPLYQAQAPALEHLHAQYDLLQCVGSCSSIGEYHLDGTATSTVPRYLHGDLATVEYVVAWLLLVCKIATGNSEYHCTAGSMQRYHWMCFFIVLFENGKADSTSTRKCCHVRNMLG
jgi:hypothetical protein